MRNRLWVISGLAVVAVLAAACGSSGGGGGTPASTPAAPPSSASPPASASSQSAMLKTTKTSLGVVLTNAQGFTLYWFAPDSSSASKCVGSCASAWPPLTGQPQAEPGVSLSGALGTITRSDGSAQATYRGHPLYRYALDTKPGMTSGNGVGGVWHVMMVSGGGAASASPSQSSTGYGY